MLHFKKQMRWACGIGLAVLGLLRLGFAAAGDSTGAPVQTPQLTPLPTTMLGFNPTPTPTFALPISEGDIAATVVRQVGDKTKIVVLSSAYEGGLRPALFYRLKQYDVRDGQPVIPAQVTSFSKGIFRTRNFPLAGIYFRSDAELRLLNGNAYLVLMRFTSSIVELTIYQVNPDVPTKASMAAEEREVLQQELKRGQTPLFVGIDTYKVEDDPQWKSMRGTAKRKLHL